MKYLIFFICIASLIVGLSYIVLYFTDTSIDLITPELYEIDHYEKRIKIAT